MIANNERICDLVDVEPKLLADWLRTGEAVLVDVREDFERAAERIEGSQHTPLGRIDPAELRQRFGNRRIVFHCRSGKRSAEAAQRCMCDDRPVFQLQGGIEGWKRAGMPTQRSATAPKFDVMRQTQVVIGTLVLLGVLLGAFVSPWFLLISGMMGAGLVFAGATGTCGLAMALAKMPWNRICTASGSQACTEPSCNDQARTASR